MRVIPLRVVGHEDQSRERCLARPQRYFSNLVKVSLATNQKPKIKAAYCCNHKVIEYRIGRS